MLIAPFCRARSLLVLSCSLIAPFCRARNPGKTRVFLATAALCHPWDMEDDDEGGYPKGPPRLLMWQEVSGGVAPLILDSLSPSMTAGQGNEDTSPLRKHCATAFQGAKSNRLGPTAPRSGPTISCLGSTAPTGGPLTVISSDDSEALSADHERSSDSQSRSPTDGGGPYLLELPH